MKNSAMNTLNKAFFIFLSGGLLFLSACDDDDPVKENTPEMITQVMLTFAPEDGGSPTTVTATDPDGMGAQDIIVEGTITLNPDTKYVLAIALFNTLVGENDAGYNVTHEVEEEAHEHLFFFQWTEGVFVNPAGNGNLDNRSDAVNYEDEDRDGLPLGLVTSWTTGAASAGSFRVVLKHQPDLKSESSSSTIGETDLDIEFDIVVE